MDEVVGYFKNKLDYFLGWFETLFHKESDYKYLIDSIALNTNENGGYTTIYYKTVGCRNLQRESAVYLNNSTIFALFRPDHAQMIVSIATIESIIDKSPEEIKSKFHDYVSYCALKTSGRTT